MEDRKDIGLATKGRRNVEFTGGAFTGKAYSRLGVTKFYDADLTGCLFINVYGDRLEFHDCDLTDVVFQCYTGQNLVIDGCCIEGTVFSASSPYAASIQGSGTPIVHADSYVEGLATKILGAIEQGDGLLDMTLWHAMSNPTGPMWGVSAADLAALWRCRHGHGGEHTCGTSHCLAGWAQVLSTNDEYRTHPRPDYVGALMFLASTGHIPRFYEMDNDVALEKLRHIARVEGNWNPRVLGGQEFQKLLNKRIIGCESGIRGQS